MGPYRNTWRWKNSIAINSTLGWQIEYIAWTNGRLKDFIDILIGKSNEITGNESCICTHLQVLFSVISLLLLILMPKIF